uniref:BHLH transcriptional factor n=1 Tax=Gentiana triflora TaxID=55190 RepID=B7XEI1_GENTR|nr:bHLH transcriptional factor [Gentiana triflora]BAH03388.1 bHLH transcriptional factor [Gentiana triflora]
MSEGVKSPVAPRSQHLQNMLQRAVQTVRWTYSIYWKLCPLQRILVWNEGYYNGEIKTRKTVQLKEVSAEEASLQRSQQLRELYETLCAGSAETNHQTRRPSAALSPEDLTESEWFYLLCFSYFFPPAVGLPGRAYARRQHVWLTGANEVQSHIFSRAILAKSAEIQTVVCIPLLEGVVELGTTLNVPEDLGFIQRIINFFIGSQESQPPPKPALSEQSTSNPPPVSGFRPSSTGIASLPPAAIFITISPQVPPDTHNQTEQVYEEEEGGDEDDDYSRNSDHHTLPQSQTHQTSKDDRMQLDDDSNDDMDSDYRILPNTKSQIGNRDPMGSETTEYLGGWQYGEDDDHPQLVPLSPPGISSFDELAQEEDTHYSQTVSIILQGQSNLCSDISSATNYIHHSPHSAFFKWSSSGGYSASHHLISGSSSQRLLKYILYTVPFLHSKDSGGKSQKPSTSNPASSIPKGGTSQEVLIGGANHVLSERRRREKLNERFITLRSLVPFVTKMDKASVLGDTIEYVKQLRKKIQELEARVKQVEGSKENDNQAGGQSMIKKKMRLIDRESGGGKLKAVTGNEEPAVHVEVSIIENKALVKLECRHREGLFLDIIQMLKQIRVEITAVQSSVSNGVFLAELRAKVKENLNGKKVTIMEVKKAILQTVSPQ